MSKIKGQKIRCCGKKLKPGAKECPRCHRMTKAGMNANLRKAVAAQAGAAFIGKAAGGQRVACAPGWCQSRPGGNCCTRCGGPMPGVPVPPMGVANKSAFSRAVLAARAREQPRSRAARTAPADDLQGRDLMFGITEIQQEMAAVEKRRKDKRDWKDRDAGGLREALSAAHEAEEAGMEAMRGENGRSDGDAEAGAARKAVSDIGCTDPGARIMQPHDMADADVYNRPYLESGTASPGPGYAPPVQAPLPPAGRGILEPTPMPGLPELAGHNGPIVASMAQHQARAATTMPSMPIPRGAA